MLQLVNSKIKPNISRLLDLLGKRWTGITLLGVLYFLLGLQGFDRFDEGLIMSCSQQFFSAPESVSSFFSCYLTILVGGIWDQLFGWGGFVAHRVLNILTMLASFSLVYQILKDYTKSRYWILVGFYLVYIDWSFCITFHYNDFSAFWGVLMCYFLHRAYIADSMKKCYLNYFIASFVAAVAVFARLANLTYMGVIGIAFLFLAFREKSWRQAGRYFLCAVGGYLAGCLLMGGVLSALGHWDLFLDQFRGTMGAASSASSTHNLPYLLSVYGKEYRLIFVILLLTVLGYTMSVGMWRAYPFRRWELVGMWGLELGGIYLLAGWIPELTTALVATVTLRFLLTFLRASWRGHQTLAVLLMVIELALVKIYSRPIYVMFGVGILGAIVALYVHRKDKACQFLLCISLSLAVLLPLGCDIGIYNVGHVSAILLVPACILLYWEGLPLIRHAEVRAFFRHTLFGFVLVYWVFSLYGIKRGHWFDYGSRFEKRYRITQSDLANVYTTKVKAEAMDTLLVHLKPYVKEGNYAFFFQNMPALHYMTRTKPYLYTAWPWCYSPETMKTKIDQAEKEIKVLPVVVREKSGLNPDWEIPQEHWDDTTLPDDWEYKAGRIVLIQDFIKRHHYKLVWENELFQIYLPGKRKIRKLLT
jgi:hypothetical protein